MKEVWKQINGDPMYEVSNKGGVRSWLKSYKYGTKADKPRPLSIHKIGGRSQYPGKGGKGEYPAVSIRGKIFYIHRLMAQAFIPNPENKATVNHKDGVKDNNIITNLEWTTHKENMSHALKTGLKTIKKEKEPIVYTYSCLECGKAGTYCKTRQRKFCSKECKGKYHRRIYKERRETWTPDYHYKYKDVTKEMVYEAVEEMISRRVPITGSGLTLLLKLDDSTHYIHLLRKLDLSLAELKRIYYTPTKSPLTISKYTRPGWLKGLRS